MVGMDPFSVQLRAVDCLLDLLADLRQLAPSRPRELLLRRVPAQGVSAAHPRNGLPRRTFYALNPRGLSPTHSLRAGIGGRALVEHVPRDHAPRDGEAEGARGGHPHRRHELAGNEFAHAAPKHGPSIRCATVGRGPRALGSQTAVRLDLPYFLTPVCPTSPGKFCSGIGLRRGAQSDRARYPIV